MAIAFTLNPSSKICIIKFKAMKYIPLGTAGHVDHGKTSLIKALTSIDTDRLPEEKKRGMSIDIGFAYLDFPEEGLRVEIIDVPGHERFIKNTICGMAPVWGVLLVVDAGEGVMPQTVQHLRVARAFGIRRVLVVLTKIDRVDSQTVELAKEEVKELLEKEGMQAFSFYPVSSIRGEGLEELRRGLLGYAKECYKNREEDFFRFYVDSAFVVKGYGTVIRGSCVSGKVEEGEILVLEPVGIKGKVKKLQNHGVFVKEGKAGERLAINMPEIDHRRVERGFLLLKEGQLIKSQRLLVRLEGKAPKGVGYLFLGMREVSFRHGRVEEDICLLSLSEPLPAVRGDRGPLLDSSGSLTGSYEVLHPLPLRFSKKFIKENLSLLLERPEEYLLLEVGKGGLSLERLFSFFGKPVEPSRIKGVKVGRRLYHSSVIEELKQSIKRELEGRGGFLSLSELRERLGVSKELLEHVLKDMKELTLLEGYVLDARRANLEELEGYRRLMEMLREGIREERELLEYAQYLPLAVRRGKAHSLGHYLYISDQLLREYEATLRSLGREFTVQQAKEKLRLTRKYLIPLLEYMDRSGITRREGERRVFVKWSS